MTSKSPLQEPLKIAGLFAGIGGIEKGLEMAGHQVEVLCEIDKSAQAVLEKGFGCELVADIREVAAFGDIDLIAAGFPCSDLSQAGRTGGIKGKNSGLVSEVFRIVDAGTEVQWLLFENVPFMLALERGRAMRWLAAQLEGRGFTWAYRVVDTRAFGLPQRRRRVVLLASQEHDPRPVLLNDDTEKIPAYSHSAKLWRGFYWTEGNTGLGMVTDAVPPLKNGSTLGIPSPPAIWMPGAGRVVTPAIEDAERLQGFPMHWTKPVLEDESVKRPYGVRWKLVGNAVSVPVTKWIGKGIGRQADYDEESDVRLTSKDRWPVAAWGQKGKRRKVDVSEWPVVRSTPHLHDFLLRDTADLSYRAAAGFQSRLVASSLRAPDQFLRDLELHVKTAANGNGHVPPKRRA